MLQVILPALSDYDVLVQVKACALSQINTKVSGNQGLCEKLQWNLDLAAAYPYINNNYVDHDSSTPLSRVLQYEPYLKKTTVWLDIGGCVYDAAIES